ncbi:MAG: potassium channel family protein [Chthoniobacterales bacterium]|nr:potassium channel family protein [Chthoniobacterales bacterium]
MKKKLSAAQKVSLILCATLFFLLFFGPILKRGAIIPILLLGLSGKVIVGKKVKRYFAHFLLCLLLPVGTTLIAYLIGLLNSSDRSTLISIVIHTAIVGFLVVYAVDSVSELMRSHQTSIAEVVGALNTYIIVGLIYGEIYALAAHFQPGSFSIGEAIWQQTAQHQPMHNSWPYIYFSFIAQTSLGFGDITPVSHLTQVLVISQGIFGQFYIAIVLAYLLHNYITNSEKNEGHTFLK